MKKKITPLTGTLFADCDRRIAITYVHRYPQLLHFLMGAYVLLHGATVPIINSISDPIEG